MSERRAVIFLGPERSVWPGLRERINEFEIGKVLSADTGAILAMDLGYFPEVVVGDLDSLREEEIEKLVANGLKLERWPKDKDYTDFELCLNHPLLTGEQGLLIVGGLGGRIDHTILNVEMVARRNLRAATYLFPGGEAHVLYEGIPVKAKGGEVVSILPLTERAEVEGSEGLRWDISGLTLRRGIGKPIHNMAVKGQVEVKLKRGKALLIVYYREEL
ncbi:MAG: thiamine diphosphokinase [Thermoplasmata archaeon]|nr:thiamine diphosphokinase [Thermoplasmata archaeon]